MKIANATTSNREDSVLFTFCYGDFLFLWTLIIFGFWRENRLEELVFAPIKLDIEQLIN